MRNYYHLPINPEVAISYHKNTKEIEQKYLITEQQFNQLRELS